MIKAVLFDLDNTLMDFMKMKKHACEEAMSAMRDAGLNVDKKKGLKILYELYDKHGIEDKTIFQKVLTKLNKKIDYCILANGIVSYRKVKEGFLNTYPHVNSTLMGLKQKGIKLAVVSDAPRMRAWTRLAALRLTHYFDLVITHDDTKKFKPHPKPFKLALTSLKLEPEEVLMIGDWPERDVRGAKKLGMKTCFAKYGYSVKHRGIPKDYADYEIGDVRELLKIVRKENK
ncbi:TIGR02253 family HAD-type hydrolase [Nanoarchaeota archaeon]